MLSLPRGQSSLTLTLAPSVFREGSKEALRTIPSLQARLMDPPQRASSWPLPPDPPARLLCVCSVNPLRAPSFHTSCLPSFPLFRTYKATQPYSTPGSIQYNQVIKQQTNLTSFRKLLQSCLPTGPKPGFQGSLTHSHLGKRGSRPTSPRSLGKAVSSHGGTVGPCPLIFSRLSHALQKSGNSIARGCFPILAQPVPPSRGTSLLLPCLPAHPALHPKDGSGYLGLCLLILGVWNPQAQSYTAAAAAAANSVVFCK